MSNSRTQNADKLNARIKSWQLYGEIRNNGYFRVTRSSGTVIATK